MKSIRYLSQIIPLWFFTAAASAAPVQITFSTLNDTEPQWRPGSNQIAYIQTGTDRDVRVVNSNGTGDALVNSVVSVAGSGDPMGWVGGSVDMVVSDVGGTHETFNLNTSTSSLTQLLTYTSGTRHAGAVSVSRDGSTVVWREAANAGNFSQIRVDSYTDLVNNASQNAGVAGDQVYFSSNTSTAVRGIGLTPNGSHAIMSIPTGTLGGWDLFKLDADPTGGFDAAVQLTTTGQTLGLDNYWADVSPDSQSILFARGIEGDANNPFDIYRMSINGTGLVNLTNSSAQESEPTWASNGLDYAFIRYDTNLGSDPDNWNVYVGQATASAVPVPAALPLFGGGLISLFGLGRCRRAKRQFEEDVAVT